MYIVCTNPLLDAILIKSVSVSVELQTNTLAPSYANLSSRSVAEFTIDWYPEHILDQFQNSVISL